MYPAWLFLPGYLSMLSKTTLICSISYGLMSSCHACFISFLIHFTFYASVFFLSFQLYFFLNISDSCRSLSRDWMSVLGAEFIIPELIPAATADPCMWPSKRQQEKCAFRAILVLIFLCAGGNRQTLGRNLRKQKGVPGINFPWKKQRNVPSVLREAGGNEEQCVLGTQTRQPGKQNALCCFTEHEHLPCSGTALSVCPRLPAVINNT